MANRLELSRFENGAPFMKREENTLLVDQSKRPRGMIFEI